MNYVDCLVQPLLECQHLRPLQGARAGGCMTCACKATGLGLHNLRLSYCELAQICMLVHWAPCLALSSPRCSEEPWSVACTSRAAPLAGTGRARPLLQQRHCRALCLDGGQVVALQTGGCCPTLGTSVWQGPPQVLLPLWCRVAQTSSVLAARGCRQLRQGCPSSQCPCLWDMSALLTHRQTCTGA